MKLLVAIKSKGNAHKVAKSLRWASRSGYDLHVFVPANEWEDYNDALKTAEQDYYLHLPDDTLVLDKSFKLYAAANKYQLVVCINDSRPSFTGKRKNIDLAHEVFHFCEEAGKARLAMSKDPKLQTVKVTKGITMERVMNVVTA